MAKKKKDEVVEIPWAGAGVSPDRQRVMANPVNQPGFTQGEGKVHAGPTKLVEGPETVPAPLDEPEDEVAADEVAPDAADPEPEEDEVPTDKEIPEDA